MKLVTLSNKKHKTMNCTFNSNKTEFLVVDSLQNVSMARQYCEKTGYHLGSIKKDVEQKLLKALKSCNIVQYQLIADQEKDDKNSDCYLIYEQSFTSDGFEKQNSCDNSSHNMFLCSKSIKSTPTTSLSNNNENGSNSLMIATIAIVLAVIIVIAVLSYFIRKKIEMRRNPTENVEMQPIASTSAKTVCFKVKKT